MSGMSEEWKLLNLPPGGHKDVAAFANNLFEISRPELERPGKHDKSINPSKLKPKRKRSRRR